MTDGKIHNIISMPSYCSETLKLAWTIQGRIQDFPESGTPTLQLWWGGGATYDFTNFSQNMHEIE